MLLTVLSSLYMLLVVEQAVANLFWSFARLGSADVGKDPIRQKNRMTARAATLRDSFPTWCHQTPAGTIWEAPELITDTHSFFQSHPLLIFLCLFLSALYSLSLSLSLPLCLSLSLALSVSAFPVSALSVSNLSVFALPASTLSSSPSRYPLSLSSLSLKAISAPR